MLKLILQTHEGQQIELNVQPEDTFADLKSQCVNNEGCNSPSLLEELITNGANIPETTKIFDYITASAHEWCTADMSPETQSFEAVGETIEEESKFKKCCAQGCLNTEITMPNKPFFPLPMDYKLSACLAEIGRLDLYESLLCLDSKNCEKYFLCIEHFRGDSIITDKSENYEELSNSITPESWNVSEDSKNNILMTKENIKKDIDDEARSNDTIFREINFNTKDSIISDLSDTEENSEHVGILCRLCGKVTENPIHLYSTNDENVQEEFTLADKVNLCLPITITVTDPLPKQICQDCHVKLNVCHDLALSSLQAEDKLKTLLREKKFCMNDDCEKRCPLCREGDMRPVHNSGIYRKEDFESLSVMKAKSVPLPVNYLDILSPAEEKQLPTSDDLICESSMIVLQEQMSQNEIPLPLPNGEFFCSICSEKIDSSTLREHQCQSGNRISSRSCVICSDANFADAEALETHYNFHELNEDKFDEAKLIDPTELEKYPLQVIANNNCSENTSDLINVQGVEKFQEQSLKASSNGVKARYACKFCKKEFSRKGSLEKHTIAHHSESLRNLATSRCYKCRICCEAFARAIDAEAHVRLSHLLSYVGKDVNSAQSESLVDELTVTCLYICEFCEHAFTVPSSLHEHREAEHAKTVRYTCATCNLSFETHRLLAKHKTLRSHRKQLDELGAKQLYVCKYCDKTFLHHSSHTSHVTGHKELPRPYICRICNFSFESYREISTHRDEAHPYRSMIHERSSLTYDCQYCRKQFSQEVALVKHIRMHTGERPYKCTICGKGFTQSSGLYTHLRIHSDLRPFSCTKCPRTFKIKGDRDNHMKKHTGHRPYKCEFCSKTFMTQHVYSQHCKIHTDIRPYKCELCDQAFRRSHVLTVHMRRHTGEKPHVCDLCPKSYRQRGDLSKHRRLQHGINGIANTTHLFAADDPNFDDCSKASKFTDLQGNSMCLSL